MAKVTGTGRPIFAAEGGNALLTCVTHNLGDNTVMWKFGGQKLLTAGTNRVVADKRFQVLHDVGGDVYVLAITNVTANDSGTYVCEINTVPPSRSFHKLKGTRAS